MFRSKVKLFVIVVVTIGVLMIQSKSCVDGRYLPTRRGQTDGLERLRELLHDVLETDHSQVQLSSSQSQQPPQQSEAIHSITADQLYDRMVAATAALQRNKYDGLMTQGGYQLSPPIRQPRQLFVDDPLYKFRLSPTMASRPSAVVKAPIFYQNRL